MIGSFVLRSAFNIAGVTASLVALVYPAAALAVGVQTGVILDVSVGKTYAGGYVSFKIIGSTPTGKPACAVADTNMWGLKFADNNIMNNAFYAALLSAQASGLTVTVAGTGTCTVVPWLEDADSITVSK